MVVRTFLALDIAEATRDALVAAAGELRDSRSKVRWVAPENLHVTVKFLGDVAEDDVRGVCDAVAEAARAVEPFDFHVRELRCMPPGGKVRMVWAGVDEPSGRLAELFGKLEAVLEPLGFPPERRSFSPHVTLGRVKFVGDPRALRAAAGRYAEEHFGAQRAEHVAVYRSELTGQGPIYSAMARPPIGGC